MKLGAVWGQSSVGVRHHCRVITLNLSNVSFSKEELCFEVRHDAILKRFIQREIDFDHIGE